MWHRLDPAQGTVTVPAGTSVLLHIGSDDLGDLPALGKRGGDDLQGALPGRQRRCRRPAIRHLRGLTGLQTLDLARTHVTDAGLTHLAPLERLLQINLANTGTTAHGRARLAAQLPQLTILPPTSSPGEAAE
jgi:hypothetical protein